MLRFYLFKVFILVASLAIPVAGCGGGSSTPRLEGAAAAQTLALDQLAESYRMYSIAKKGPPQKLADLVAIDGLAGNGVSAARNGDIVVQWGAKLSDTGEEPGKTPSSEILAYWKDVPEKGGWVLMLDRTLKEMTADQFKSAPKAAGSGAAASKT